LIDGKDSINATWLHIEPSPKVLTAWSYRTTLPDDLKVTKMKNVLLRWPLGVAMTL